MKNTMLKTLILLMSLMASAAFAGGAGDGGGDILPDDPANPYQVQRWLDEAKLPVRLALNHLEYNLLSFVKAKDLSGDMLEVYRKLFASKKTIYQSLDEAIWVPLEKGGCEDLGGNEHDASALKDAPRICFAMENLSHKLQMKSGRSKIVALIAHEVSHLSGTTEEEAVIVQKMIQNDVSDSIFSIKDAVSSVKEAVGGIVESLDNLSRSASGRDGLDQYFCTLLPVALTEINSLQERNFDYGSSVGIMFFTANNTWKIPQALMRAINLMSVCATNKHDEAAKFIAQLAKVFAGKKQIMMSEFYRRYSTLPPNDTTNADLDYKAFVGEDRPIRRLTPKSKAAILAEIQEMVTIIKPLQAELR
jgi:hypothetical protein